MKKAWSGSILTYGKRREIQTIRQRRPNTFQKNASTVTSSMHMAADAVLLKNLIFESNAFQVVFLEPGLRDFNAREHLEVIDVAVSPQGPTL